MVASLIASSRMPLGVAACGLTLWLTYATAKRLAPRVFAAPSSTAEGWLDSLLHTLLLCALLIVWPVAGLGFAGWLSGTALAAVAVCLFVGSRFVQDLEHGLSQFSGTRWSTIARWPVILTGLLVASDLLAHLPAPPIDWDAATYHLYLPARWLQEGQIFHIPTVFSDNAAAFAPQNGTLFFAWQMGLLGYDTLTNVSQLFCLVILGLALYRICRLLSIDQRSATLAAMTLPWLAPIRRWTYSANVDIFMISFALAALYWVLLYLDRPSRSSALACGLATGLAAGTKTVGLPLGLWQAIPLVIVALRRRRLADLGGFAVSVVGGGGWWYLLNTWRYGNPVFPVQLSLPGGGVLRGAYDAAAVRAGEFHLDGLRAVGASVRDQWGLTTCLLMILGLVTLMRRARRDIVRRHSQPHAWVLLALAVGWWIFFVTTVPHNNQARFALPVLAISLVGWGLVLQQARRSGPRVALGVWSAGVAAAALAAQPWRDWLGSLATLARAEVDVIPWGEGGGVLIGSLALAVMIALASFRRWRPTRLTAWVAGSIITLFAVNLAEASRPAFFALADYRGWAEGYLPFNHPQSEPARIAYTGANVPYALIGGDRRHRVVYLNTQGHADDGFYDFWLREQRTYPYHKPGIYRGHDDVDLWLERLAEQNIDTVVIFALHPVEQRYIHSTPDGFPIERDWVKSRADRFQPIFASRAAEIYRVAP